MDVILAILCVLGILAFMFYMAKRDADNAPDPEEIKAVVKAVHYSPEIQGFIADQSAFYEMVARDTDGNTYTTKEQEPMVVGDKVTINRFESGHDFWSLDR